MPLSLAPAGKQMKVVKVGGEVSIVRHLSSLGIVKDSLIEVISQEGSGSIVLVKGTRLALNSDVARHILVA